MMASYEPYAPRPVENHGRLQRSGHQLKLYSIRYGETPIDLDAYGHAAALAQLEDVAGSDARRRFTEMLADDGR